MFLVGAAAAILSFDTWVRLAQAVGFTATLNLRFAHLHIAWLLPIAVDTFAYVSTKAWITGGSNRTSTRTAALNSVAIIAVSVAGNALYHAYTAAGWVIHDSPVIVIIIGGIPPLLLGLVVHLHTMSNRTEPQVHARTEPVTTEPNPTVELHTVEPEPEVEPNPLPRIGAELEVMVQAVRPFVTEFTTTNGRIPGRHSARNELARLGYRVGLPRAQEIAKLAADARLFEKKEAYS